MEMQTFTTTAGISHLNSGVLILYNAAYYGGSFSCFVMCILVTALCVFCSVAGYQALVTEDWYFTQPSSDGLPPKLVALGRLHPFWYLACVFFQI